MIQQIKKSTLSALLVVFTLASISNPVLASDKPKKPPTDDNPVIMVFCKLAPQLCL